MGEEGVKMQPEIAKVEETKVEEAKGGCPSNFVLFVDLHCSGCAKKIAKSVMRIRGVEGVGIDMAKNQVTIKGIVDPEGVCAKITNKTKRAAKVLSPPPPEGEPLPQLLNSKVVELNVNMHCQACAHQLKKKILKMRGVQTASTELSTGKVVVTGTMDGNKLVEYVYRRTKKQAEIVPQPQPTPPPEPEEKKEGQEAEAEAAPAPAEAAATTAEAEIIKSDQETETNKNKVEEQEEGKAAEEETKPSVVEGEGGDEIMDEEDHNHENMKRMMMYQSYQYQPLYVIERIPPPQLFSDENPNACCIQ